jgi:hypothetical protein
LRFFLLRDRHFLDHGWRRWASELGIGIGRALDLAIQI